MNKTSQYFFTKFVLSVFFFLSIGCGNIPELAQNFLYPVESVNEVAVPNDPPEGYGQALLDVKHSNGPLKIHLWYRKHTQDSDAPVVIHFHGNGENIGRLAKGGFFPKMESLGAHFVVMDYPGYGKSTGHPEQSTLMAAADATFQWTRKKFPQSAVVIWGWSMGSAVGLQTFALYPDSISAVIADSAWSNIRTLAKEKFGSLADQIPEELYAKNEWDSLAVAPMLSVPTLMRHGTDDEVVPLKHGKRVSELVKDDLIRFQIINKTGHGDIFNSANYWSDLKSFIALAK